MYGCKTLGTVYRNIYYIVRVPWRRRLESAMSQSNHQNVELMCPSCSPADDCSSCGWSGLSVSSPCRTEDGRLWKSWMSDFAANFNICTIVGVVSFSIATSASWTHLPGFWHPLCCRHPVATHFSVHDQLISQILCSSFTDRFSQHIQVCVGHSEYFFYCFCIPERKLYFICL